MAKQIRIPSYRLHKPTGQAVVTLSGRDYYLGKHDTPESYEAYERSVLAWRAHGTPSPRKPPPLTIASMVGQFWQHVERTGLYTKHGRKTSERLCLAVALRPLVRLYGGQPASEFGPLALQTVRKALCSPLPPPKNGEQRRRVHTGPIVRSSVNKHVHRIRRVFRWAAAMQMIPASVWDSLRALDGLRRGQATDVRESRKVGPAPLRAVVAVLREIATPFRIMIRLQWLTGARPGEIVQMRVGDIDRKGRVWVYRPGSHKNEHRDQDREIAIGPRAQRVLGDLPKDDAAFVFPGRKRGRHVTEAGYARAIARVCAKLGLERWTPHQLRHNAATRVQRSHGIEAARTVLGHADVGTTLIYAERDRRKVHEIAAAHG